MSHSALDSLQHVVAHQAALLHQALTQVDSLRAIVPDTVVRVAERPLPQPLVVESASSLWNKTKDTLSLLIPIFTFGAGVWTTLHAQDRKEQRDETARIRQESEVKRARQKTAGRLTRRYLLFGEDVLKYMVDSIQNYKTLGPAKGGFFSAAYVLYALEALSDFQEIKDRMIEFEDDDLEEAIWRWHARTMNELRTMIDVLGMSDEQLKAKHGEWQNQTLMFESERAMFNSCAYDAAELAKRVEKYV
jgi:hypothetical protein